MVGINFVNYADREIINGEIFISSVDFGRVRIGRVKSTPEQMLNRIRYVHRATSGVPCLQTPVARIVASLNAGKKPLTPAEWALEMGINPE